MGNWRTVDMVGHIDKSDVEDIRSYLFNDSNEAWCFTIGEPSLCGLNQWINDDGTIDISANLYERDIDNDDIKHALEVLAGLYPSLSLTLHSGSDYESTICSATFHVHNGTVTMCPPEVEQIRECRCLSIEDYFAILKNF